MLHACYLLMLSVAYKSSDCCQTAAEIISLMGFVKSWEFPTKSRQSSRGQLVFWTAGVSLLLVYSQRYPAQQSPTQSSPRL